MGNSPEGPWARVLYQLMFRSRLILALEILQPIPPDVLLHPLHEFVENDPGTPWSNSIRFPYQLLIIHGWRMVLEFPGPIPTAFRGRSEFDMENDLGVHLSSSLLDYYQECMEIATGAP